MQTSEIKMATSGSSANLKAWKKALIPNFIKIQNDTQDLSCSQEDSALLFVTEC